MGVCGLFKDTVFEYAVAQRQIVYVVEDPCGYRVPPGRNVIVGSWCEGFRVRLVRLSARNTGLIVADETVRLLGVCPLLNLK